MGLKEWLKNAWLIEHDAGPQEIPHLLRLADRDLADAAAGYRAAKEAHHYRVIQSLKYTLRSDEKLILKLDAFRKKRNISEYDHAGSVTETELNEMIELARELREAVSVKATGG